MNTVVKPECKFCRGNDILEGEVLAESSQAYMIHAGQFEQNYLIIPSFHTELLDDLSDDWWREVKAMISQIKDLVDYNLSINIGSSAGQTMKHLHFWIIPRRANMPSSGKGLARLISECDK